MTDQRTVETGRPLSLRQVLPWMLLALLLVSAPFVLAWRLAPEGSVFQGGLVNVADLSVYLSAIRQGAAGNWLFHFYFAPEDLTPRLTYLPYLLLGRLPGLFGGSLVVWFHLARLAGALVALLTMLFWVRQALPRAWKRQRSAWLLTVFGSGLGWLMLPLMARSGVAGLDQRSIRLRWVADFLHTEWTVVGSLLNSGHFALGLAAEGLLFAGMLQIGRNRQGRRWPLLAALGALLLALTYPYAVPVAGLVCGLFLAALALRRRGIPWSAWRRAAPALAVLAAFLLYYAASSQDPAWSNTHIEANVVKPPPPLGAVLAWGWLGVLAVAGGWRWLRRGRSPLLPLWAVVNVLIIYLPVSFAGRWIFGAVIPVGTLAGYGLETAVLPALRDGRPGLARFGRPLLGAARTTLVIPATLTPFVKAAFLALSVSLLVGQGVYYQPESASRAATWLAEEMTAGELVLTDFDTGNYLPRTIPGEVFVGHWAIAPQSRQKEALVARFWEPETSDAWRRELIREWGVDYIYESPALRRAAGPDMQAPGQVVYDEGGVVIYRVDGSQLSW